MMINGTTAGLASQTLIDATGAVLARHTVIS
jgi:hypothetical protein